MTLAKRRLDIEKQRVVLMTLHDLAYKFGIANDAQDHGSADEAERLRKKSTEGIRRLMAENPFLAGLFPDLERELDRGLLEGHRWSTLCDRVDVLLTASSYLRP